MDGDTCTKDYPKQFHDRTSLVEDGYPSYRRRNNGRTFEVRGHQVDNRWIVPYNPYLSLKFNAHINLEACTSVKSVKYLFKYVYKGHDCANVEVTESATVDHDEIKNFLDARYVSAPEACWRLFKFPMHRQSHSIVRLALHLPDHQAVYFTPGNAADAADAAAQKETTLTAYFKYNQEHATDLCYHEFPQKYVYEKKNGTYQWRDRAEREATTIGIVYTASPKDVERFCLRLLLHHVPGATSYEDLRTVNGHVAASFKEACLLRHLLEDDTEWDNTLQEAATFQMPRQMRSLFATICLYCNPSNPRELWDNHKDSMCEDFVHDRYSVIAAEQMALHHIDSLLKPDTSCVELGLPEIDVELPERDPADFNPDAERALAEQLIAELNEEQAELVSLVTDALRSMEQEGEAPTSRAFFLDGPGGTGKTRCYNTLISWCRGQGFKVAPSAWTGIAATLLKGGRTCHSLFKLPVPILDNSTCNVSPTSHLADLLTSFHMFIIDEASMVPAHALRAIDQLLRDLTGNDVPFGGKVFLLGGDFRQVLPIVPKRPRTVIVENCLKSSPLWNQFRVVHLHRNMRVNADEQMFAEWLLKLGDGTMGAEGVQVPDAIEIPKDCNVSNNIINDMFPIAADGRELADTVILSPTNETALMLNKQVLRTKVVGEEKVYHSADKAICEVDEEAANYPIEFLNSLTPSGMPPHQLLLKRGAVVMLLRNLNIQKGLCNGTRLIIDRLHDHILQATILTGSCQGQQVLIPRIKLAPSDTNLPFVLQRTQFPVRLSYAMTINKAQGQTFKKVGIYLRDPVFAHGQLYVAFSRARSFKDIHIQLFPTHTQGLFGQRYLTTNVVYKEVLR